MESTGWAVIRTTASLEPLEEALDRIGYTVYLPRYKARLIGVRIDAIGRRIRTRGLGSIVERVLIPGYILVWWPAGGLRERPIAILGGYILRHPLGADGQAWPKLVSVEEVDKLRARVAAGEFDSVGASQPAGKRPWQNLATLQAELLAAAE
jgi:hypothetical protein